MLRKNVTLIIYIVLCLCITINTCFAKETRKWFTGVYVVVKIHDKTPHGMTRYRINKDVLAKHFKGQLTEILNSTQYSISFRSTDPHLIIDVTITGKPLISKYNIITNASLDDGMEEWEVGFVDYWDKQKNIAPVRRYEEYIKSTKKIIALGRQVVGYGSASSEVEEIYKGKVEELKDDLARAKKMLAEAKKNATITGTIKQMLNTIASEFVQYYRLVRQYEYEFTQQATEIEDLQNQLEDGYASVPRQETRRYVEPRSPAGRNVLYETGNIIKLHNPADTCFTIYKTPALKNSIILFLNGIPAKVIDYKALRGEPIVYKVHIVLKDGSEYTGWVPEGAIKD
ncbi:MAG: hypothetical protein ACUZ8I_00735 [Candidatus Scalindua sp.]